MNKYAEFVSVKESFNFVVSVGIKCGACGMYGGGERCAQGSGGET
jgi:hypothetical protein